MRRVVMFLLVAMGTAVGLLEWLHESDPTLPSVRSYLPSRP